MPCLWPCGCLQRAHSQPYFGWSYGLVMLLLVLAQNCFGRVHKGSAICEKYDRKQCLDGTGSCTTTLEECANVTTANNDPLDEPHNHMLCFATWIVINNTEQQLIKKGCWMNDNKCYGQRECVEDKYSAPAFFCCCDGDLCNKEYHHRPAGDHQAGSSPKEASSLPEPGGVVRRSADQQLMKTLLYSLVPIIGGGVLVVTLFFMWRRHQHHMGHIQLPTVDPSLAPTPSQSSLNLQLLELRARGRYGSLWKAQLSDQDSCKDLITSENPVIPSALKHVAVKVFPLQDKQSWMAEVDIYRLSHMKHDNILRFIASERKEETHVTEFWLITEFHENGSLSDYLKSHTITWAELCKIGESMTCGLAYLHNEIPGTYGSMANLAIAHRDFKSKNVLLKHDLTACIADFGLALKFEPGKMFNETHPQVGTRRYMAPEVLEGAICFSLDSFLRIDMYACGLVLWEMMTRCTAVNEYAEIYRLPFEAEVGLQPTLEEMQTLVVTQKVRPAINPAWHQHQGLCSLISTVEECWDQDAEARLSAGCVNERIRQLACTVNSAIGRHLNGQILPTAVLSLQLPQINITSSCVPNSTTINMSGPKDTYFTLPNDPSSC
ncbi:unnamed protein product [Candidula unifasciata]|uniref:Serine/threonine-protein kinase receptor n=1 Tax=Candidula unifasciata TaxID=100452 RepID=A0A8S3ZVT0_9EUPU|nr:unnamed protein product [Candidula unifasciata]